jgi:multidrug efflux pump subunit AcrB
VQDVAATMRTSIFGNYRRPPLYFDPDSGNPYFIITRLQESDRSQLEDLGKLSIIREGRDIQFKNIASVVRTAGPPQFDRRAQQRVIDVLANPAGRDLGSITAELESKLAKLTLPPGVSLQLRGQTEEQRASFRGLLFASALALALVYMVLAAQYKSLLHPFITMFTVPLGFTGVFVMLYLTNTSLSTTSLMGMIMMVGLVVRSGVLLINQERLRPILMTAIATILGLLPMALAWGVGSEANAPLARAVIGGLAVSTLLTLFLVPAMYTLLEARFGRSRVRSEHEERVLYGAKPIR